MRVGLVLVGVVLFQAGCVSFSQRIDAPAAATIGPLQQIRQTVTDAGGTLFGVVSLFVLVPVVTKIAAACVAADSPSAAILSAYRIARRVI